MGTGNWTGLENLDISQATKLSHVFNQYTAAPHLNGIESWDVSHITDFRYFISGYQSTFDEADRNYELDLSNWDVSSGREFRGMFANAPLKAIKVNGWEFGPFLNASVPAYPTISPFQGATAERIEVYNWTNFSDSSLFKKSLTSVHLFLSVFL